MPAPTSLDEFLELILKSGVVDDKRLSAYVEKLRHGEALPSALPQLADLMVREGILTTFQSEQILLGKWRRFNIGKYKVLERLGSGGMGSVYLCEHKLMRRRVAIKVLPTAKADDPAALERFYREARAVAALDHPNIVRAYDIDQDDKLHFLVMEHVDGASLQEIMKRGGLLEPRRASHYMRQAALGLQHAHEGAGLVHRDIKPGNILVDRSGIVKILDMGLARFFHDAEDNITKKYDESVLGTADYLAPEQALDSHVDIRADIYSLGATFYFTLTGRTPFAEGTVAQKLIWHQTRQPKSLRSLRPDVPEWLAAIIEKMMSKDPGQRYQTPHEVVEVLMPYTRDSIPPPPDVEMPQHSLAALGGTESAGNRGEQPSLPRKHWQFGGQEGAAVPVFNPPPAPSTIRPAPAAEAPAPVKVPEVKPAPPPPKSRPPASGHRPVAPTVVAKRKPAETVVVNPKSSRKNESVTLGKLAVDTEVDQTDTNTPPTRRKRPAVKAPKKIPPGVWESHRNLWLLLGAGLGIGVLIFVIWRLVV